MNTPEPFSQTRDRQQQSFYPSGQPIEINTPQPFNIGFPPQPPLVQNQSYPSQQNAAWPPSAPAAGAFPPQTSIPNMAGSPQTLPWLKSASPQPANNFPPSPLASNPQSAQWGVSGRGYSTGNLNMTQAGGQSSGYPSPINSFAAPPLSPTSPPSATNNWNNNNQWTNGAGGSGGFSSPNRPGNTTSLHAKPPRRRNTNTVGKILLFLGLALLLVMAGIAGLYLYQGNSAGSIFTPVARQSADVKPTPTATPTPTVHMQHQQLATQYVANMSLNDEIAQLLMIEHYSTDYSPDLNNMITQQHVGSVIFYASAIVTTPQITNTISSMQQSAKIPVFTAIDEEGWNVGRLGALYPNYTSYRLDADTIGQSGDPNVAAQQGQQAAKDMLALGLNMNLAPDVDISTDDGYIGYDRRSFGSTSDKVIKYAGPYLKALQTNGVIGAIKHFPGLGSIPKGTDPHAVLPVYTGTKDQLYQNDLVPFQHFINDPNPYEQARVVMPTDMLVKAIDPRYPVELSHTFITDILRNQMGFKGVILSDSLHMGGVLVDGQALSLADASVMALEAGNDILEGASTSTEVQSIIDAINAAIQGGQLSKAQIDASVIRVLTLKMDYNVMSTTLK